MWGFMWRSLQLWPGALCSFAPFPCPLGLGRNSSFSGAGKYASRPKFNFFPSLFCCLDCLVFQDFSLINLFPETLPFLPGDGVLGSLMGTSEGHGTERGTDNAPGDQSLIP